jgi:hypothetical protein
MARKVTTKTISAKVSLVEYGIICQRAGNANKTVSAYVNDLLFAQSTTGTVKSLGDDIVELKNKLANKEKEFAAYKISKAETHAKLVEQLDDAEAKLR